MPEDDLKKAAYRRRAQFRQYLTAFIANLTAFSIGTVLGWTSPMQPLLTSRSPPIGKEPMSQELISWLASINFIGAVIGTFFWGISSDRLGRKNTALIVAIPFIISWVVVITAQSALWLIIARIIAGIGCSGVIINIPIYIAEMADDKIRGSLGSFLMIFLNTGCVFSYVLGSFTSYHGLALGCLCIPVIFLMTFSYLPESPVFLWNQGRRDDAKKSILWFRGGDIVKTVREIEVLEQRPGKPRQTPKFRDLFGSKGVKKAMIISTGFVFGQQFCGILAILSYTVKIFQDSGSSLSAHNSMIAVGCLQLSSALLSSFLVDRAGRRILLLSSYVAMALSLTTLGGYLYFHDSNWNPILQWIPIFCLSINVTSYSIGVGPVPFVVMSEIFPPDIRGFTTSKIQTMGTALSFVTVKTFPFLTKLLGSHGCFLFYAFFCAVLAIFTFIFVPETKGRTLQNILQEMNGDDNLDNYETEKLTSIHKAKIFKMPT